MATLFIFLLTLVTFILYRYKKPYFILCVITLISFMTIGCGLFSILALNYLELSGVTKKLIWTQNNALIVLGAGTMVVPASNLIQPAGLAYSRINKAAKLYSECKKTGVVCHIIISGGDASKTGQSEAVIYQRELKMLGVQSQDIILEQKSLNTYQNAEFTKALLRKKSYNTVVLVTSGIHMRRSLLYFSHFGISPTPAISDYIGPKLSLIPIGYNFAVADFIMHEYLGIMRFYIYNYVGWNVKAFGPVSMAPAQE